MPPPPTETETRERHRRRAEATGARIRAERERLGLNQSEAARLAGLDRTQLRDLEAAANPTYSTLAALVKIGMDVRAIAPELFPTAPPAPTTPPRRRR